MVHEVHVSVGEIVEVLHRVRREVEPTLEQLLHTTTWLRSPCDLWSWLARSVGTREALRAARYAWPWAAYSKPGERGPWIPSRSASPYSLKVHDPLNLNSFGNSPI